MSSVNIREEEKENESLEVGQQQRLATNGVVGNGSTVRARSESKESWSFFEKSKEDGSNEDYGVKEECPALTSEVEGEDEMVGSRDVDLTKSHESSVFVNDNEQGDSCFLLPKPNDDGNFQLSYRRSCNATESPMSESGVTILSSKLDNASSDQDMMQKVGVDLLMEKSALTGKITLQSESRSVATDEIFTPVTIPTPKVKESTDSPGRASTKTTDGGRSFPFWVGIVLLVPNTSCLFGFGWERIRMVRLEEEINSLRNVYESRERAAADQIDSLTSALQQYQRGILPWEKPREDSENLLIDNCWIQAQASL